MNAFITTLCERQKAQDRRCATIDDDSCARLDAALKSSKRKRSLKTAAWGALAPAEVVSCFANDDIINWAAYSVLDYCNINDLLAATQRPHLFLHTQVVADELKHFMRVDTGVVDGADPYEPHGVLCSPFNLSVACRLLRTNKLHSLADVEELQLMFVPLCHEGHFSSLVYSVAANELVHYDTTPGAHETRARACSRMLKRMALIPVDAQMVRPRIPYNQRGTWECGYALIAFAAHCAARLNELVELPPEGAQILVRDVVRDETHILALVRVLQKKAERAKRLSATCDTLTRFND
jgi:hypothetical protein